MPEDFQHPSTVIERHVSQYFALGDENIINYYLVSYALYLLMAQLPVKQPVSFQIQTIQVLQQLGGGDVRELLTMPIPELPFTVGQVMKFQPGAVVLRLCHPSRILAQLIEQGLIGMEQPWLFGVKILKLMYLTHVSSPFGLSYSWMVIIYHVNVSVTIATGSPRTDNLPDSFHFPAGFYPMPYFIGVFRFASPSSVRRAIFALAPTAHKRIGCCNNDVMGLFLFWGSVIHEFHCHSPFWFG
jgi:hypothetical protein